MIQYDASVIVTFAQTLYERAWRVVVTATIVGVIAGGSIGFALDTAFQTGAIVTGMTAAIAGALAFSIGQQRAFWLRLQAQAALCLVQIEANTYRTLTESR